MKKEANKRVHSKEASQAKVGATIFFLAMAAFCVIAFSHFRETAQKLVESVSYVEAVTLPTGTIYFQQDPPEYLVEHEQCHLEQMETEGVVPFYVTYFFVEGGDCRIEVSCGYDTDAFDIRNHPACIGYEFGNFGDIDSHVAHTNKPENTGGQVALQFVYVPHSEARHARLSR